jgi:hypothetical protein
MLDHLYWSGAYRSLVTTSVQLLHCLEYRTGYNADPALWFVISRVEK